ncbi:MAG: aldo/keto reductase [Actinomycetia bacterium]|nr:aldo/keto reductase [Actinomycetes bacterium]
MTLTIERITFGAATLGNLFSEVTEAESRAILEAAWSGGIRHFDTAPHYGLGLSERRLGAFLGSLSAVDSAAATVTTKVGRLLRPNQAHAGELDVANGFAVPASLRREWDPSADGVRVCLEESLERLGLDHVDGLYLHDPDEYADEVASLESGLAGLDLLRTAGLVNEVGIGSKSARMLELAVAHPATTQVMVANRFTLVDDSALGPVLGPAADRGVNVVAAAIFGSGLLARPEPAGHYDYGTAPQSVIDRAREIAVVCRAHGSDLPTAALHYVARHPAVTQVVIGSRRVDQLRENLERVANPPADALYADLADRGLAPDPAEAMR